jgi:hypothetical protein
MIKVNFFLVIIVTTLFGCTDRVNKIYDYDIFTVESGSFLITAALNGSFVSNENITVKGSPYELMIKFSTVKEVIEAIEVANVKMLYANDRSLVCEFDEIYSSNFKIVSDGSYISRIYIDGLGLEYKDYILMFLFRIKNGDGFKEETISVPLKRNYHEYESSDFLDKIMSA